MASPLDGVRVLDFTRVVSGPSGTKALVDLGAEVIKIEPPVGDLTRSAQPRVAGIPAYFAQQNTGKRCLSIDLSTDDGRSIVRRMADTADVVVENFRPGVMDRLGLGFDELRSSNPALIYCAITGYGQDGPAAHRRAYAPMMHAELGLLELAARRRRQAVVNEVVSWADLQAGLQAALAVTAALRHRDLTGEGQHIDVAMADVMLQMTEWTAVELAGGEGDKFAVFGAANAPLLTLADGSQAVVSGDAVSTWPRWLNVLDDPTIAADPRFATKADRAANRADMMAVLQAWADTVPDFATFHALTDPAFLVAGEVRPVTDVRDAQWAHHRSSLIDVGHDDELLVPRSPARYSSLDVGTRGRPVHQGADNAAVLDELLGLTPDEIAHLVESGVLVERPFSPDET